MRARSVREAHAHLYSLGESLRMTDLARCTSLEHCLELVAGAAGRLTFARLHGARVEAWSTPRAPTRAELDRAAGDVPVVILSFDHHAAYANSAALNAAGLSPGVVVPPNGVVTEDGLLIEQAAYRAWEASPEPDDAGKRSLVVAALGHLVGLGFNEVHDLHSQRWLGPILADLERSGELDALGVGEVWLYPPVADAPRPSAWATSRVRLAGFKVFLDGTLNSRTAWMLDPYRDPAPGLPHGKPMMTLDELAGAMAAARDRGVGLAVHAIGDGAVRATLDTWERGGFHASRGRLDPTVPALRIEHCELIDDADVPRFRELGVVASVQPCHLLADVEALRRYLPHRLERVLPLKGLVDAGCTPGSLLWFGSDVPIVRADPGDSIQAAVARRRPGAPQGEAVAWEQRIDEALARRAFLSGVP